MIGLNSNCLPDIWKAVGLLPRPHNARANAHAVRSVGFEPDSSCLLPSETHAVTCSVDFYSAPILPERRGLVSFKERSSRRPSTIKAESLTAGNMSGDLITVSNKQNLETSTI